MAYLKESRIGCQCVGRGGGNCKTNLRFGCDALMSWSSGVGRNVALGPDALRCLTTGYDNVAIGACAGRAITTGNRNVFIGIRAGCASSTSLSQSVVASQSTTAGGFSVSVGGSAYAGDNGVSIGPNANAGANSVTLGQDGGTGQRNVSIGAGASSNCDSVFIGRNTGNNDPDGSYQTWIGYNNNFNTSSPYNLWVGHCISANVSNPIQDTIVIADNAGVSASYHTLWGNATNNVCNCIYPDWITPSDCRDKANIQSLGYNFGIPFIKKTRPVSFNWDTREIYVKKCGFEFGQKDGTLTSKKKSVGFIAQEIRQAIQDLNLEFQNLNEESDRYRITYNQFLFPSMKAIQQISDRMDVLEEELTILENN